MNPDPNADQDQDHSIFIIDLQDANKKQFFCKMFFGIVPFSKVLLKHFEKIKSEKKIITIKIKVFITIFA
jgi:hypothetical protein